MNNLDVMFSKKSDIWSTPQDLFDKLDNEFHFNIDVCANDSNHKCSKYFTEQDDGLSKDWHGTVQMNPPYSACKDQIRKAFESSAGGATVVALVPARTDTKWFHEYVLPYSGLPFVGETKEYPVSVELRFIKGRLKFGNGKNSAPFPSVIIIFKPIERTT